jgi:predicted phosphodiesterase
VTETKRILLLSDLHVGSKWALWPPGFTSPNARSDMTDEIPQNAVNAAIWAHWKKMLAYLKKERPDCIILNGDLIEGNQHREYGRGLMTPDIGVQMEACIKVIKTLPKVPMYFTAGTDYHQLKDGTNVDLAISKTFNADFGDELVVEECGIRLFCRHAIGISNSSWQYMATAPGRDQMLLVLNKSEEKYGPIDVAVFSHRHQFVAPQFRSGIALVTPCWQGKTVFAVKKGIVGVPDIGWVMLHISENWIAVDASGIATVVRPCKVVGRDVGRLPIFPHRPTEKGGRKK